MNSPYMITYLGVMGSKWNKEITLTSQLDWIVPVVIKAAIQIYAQILHR
jgi:hypothetical protein